MDYTGPPRGPRGQNGYDATYYSEASSGGAYSQLFPASSWELPSMSPLKLSLLPRLSTPLPASITNTLVSWDYEGGWLGVKQCAPSSSFSVQSGKSSVSLLLQSSVF